MRAGDVLQVLFGLHGEIFVHRTRLRLGAGHVLQGVDLLLGQVQGPPAVLGGTGNSPDFSQGIFVWK